MEPYGDVTRRGRPRGVPRAGARARRGRRRRDHRRDADGARGAAASGSPRRRRPARPCVIGSMAYDVTRDGSTFRTMMGVDPERAAQVMVDNGVAHRRPQLRHGHGHGRGRSRPRAATGAVTDLPLMIQPNAGQPKLVDMKVVYDESPEQMAAGVVPLLDAGVAHRRRLLRQHAGPHPRVQGARWTNGAPRTRRPAKARDDPHPLRRSTPRRSRSCRARTDDRSGIGVHYVDAFIKPMNATLADGTEVKCKRRGLKITLSVGDRKGEGLMRRLAGRAGPRGHARCGAEGSQRRLPASACGSRTARSCWSCDRAASFGKLGTPEPSRGVGGGPYVRCSNWTIRSTS